MNATVKAMTILCVQLFLLPISSYGRPQERLTFASVSDLRREFSGILLRPASKSKGTVIYLHGGGCIPTHPWAEYKEWITGKMLPEAGWKVLLLDYDEKLAGDTDWAAGGIDDLAIGHPTTKARCEKNTQDLIRDISDAIVSYRDSTGEQNIFVMGHSFGAYLTNLLATQDRKISRVQGYISLHGLWNTRNLGLKIDRTVPITPNPVDRSPEKLSRILIVHTADDDAAPISQIDDLKSWLGDFKGDYQIKIYQGGGHLPGPYGQRVGSDVHWYPYRDFQRTVLSFMGRH